MSSALVVSAVVVFGLVMPLHTYYGNPHFYIPKHFLNFQGLLSDCTGAPFVCAYSYTSNSKVT
jgi:hypothetical protein